MLHVVQCSFTLTCQQRPPCFVFANCHPRCAEQLFGQQALKISHIQSHKLSPVLFVTELRGFSVTSGTFSWIIAERFKELVDHFTVTVIIMAIFIGTAAI